jgi:hypothetical protein
MSNKLTYMSVNMIITNKNDNVYLYKLILVVYCDVVLLTSSHTYYTSYKHHTALQSASVFFIFF